MRPAALVLALALLAPALRADGLSDLRAALQRLPATQPIKATVDCQVWSRTVKEKRPKIIQGQVQVKVEDGPAGLKLAWDKAELEHIQAAAKTKDDGPKQALDALGAGQAGELLDASRDLTETLDGARIQEDRPDTWQGHPARRLSLALDPKGMDASDRKHIKSYSRILTIWMGADGTPLAVQDQEDLKGSFFFIGFEAHNKSLRSFARSGDRLVTVHEESQNSGSGAGQQGEQKTVMDLKF